MMRCITQTNHHCITEPVTTVNTGDGFLFAASKWFSGNKLILNEVKPQRILYSLINSVVEAILRLFLLVKDMFYLFVTAWWAV